MKFAPITKPLSKKQVELIETFGAETPWGFIVIPEGFIYNGASIPRIGQFVLGITRFGAQVRGAAIPHDYHYTYHKFPRKQADQIFHWMLRQNGIGRIKAGLMYRTLRLFGGAAWKNK